MVAVGTGDIILFGGGDTKNGPKYNDTWSWDGSNWTDVTPTTANPPTRTAHTMAYDPTRDRVVLFSGWDGNNYIPDTWEWDGSHWIDVTPAVAPGKRDWADMVYDPNTGKILLFGGHDYQISGYKYNDTWTWDGTDWVQLFPATVPAPRGGHSMVYDQNRGTVLMIGNYSSTATIEMWEWDGSDWNQLFPTNLPSGRGWGTMAWDDARSRVVYYGGKDNVTKLLLNEVWEWEGSDWTLTSASGPAYGWTTAEYDVFRQKLLVQGGAIAPDRTAVDDKTWAYGGESLYADATTLSESTGGIVNFTLNSGSTHAGRTYFMLGSVTGTSPGFPLPGGLVLPLNWDIFTGMVFKLANTPAFEDFYGTLDGSGQATAQLDSFGPLPPGGLGVKLYFAYLQYSPFDFVSNPVAIEIVP